MADRVDDILKRDKGPKGLSEKVAKQSASYAAATEYRKAHEALHGTSGGRDDLGTSPALLSNEGKRAVKAAMKEAYKKMGVEERRTAPGKSCFVATAVYGDPCAPEVELLRHYRDEDLTRHLAGRLFIRFYYSGAGDFLANALTKCMPRLIPYARGGIDALVRRIQSRKK